MSLSFNSSPYFDDFDGSKKFHKILFKPALPVQARELNQLQSILQNQIERFGTHVFKEGTIVLGGERFYENDLLSIKLESTYSGVGINATSFDGKEITGVTSGTKAVVKAVSSATSTESITLITKITSGSGFTAGENISYLNGVTTGYGTIKASNAFDTAIIYSINSGVFFTKGNFVYVEPQTAIVSKYGADGDYSVGLVINELIITEAEDESLLDNAQGTPNFAAPGADRYSIDLVLSVFADSSDAPEDYIELTKIVGGQLTSSKDRTLYAELEKEFARRTYDESGNYTVRNFPISFRNHVGSAKARPTIVSGAITAYTITNGGSGYTSVPTVTIVGDGTGATATAVIDNNPVSATYQQVTSITVNTGGSGYTLANTVINISGDSNKLTVSLDAGKAYVKGYEFETTSQSYVSLDRARTTESADNLDSLLSYGNIIYGTSAFGVFDPTAFTAVELHDVVRASVSGATSKIGSAKVRLLKYVSGTVGSGTAIYAISLFDIVIDSGKFFKNLESIVVRSGATVLAGYNVDLLSKVDGNAANDAFLTGADQTSLVFPLNHSYVKELKDSLGNAQNDYTFRRTFNSVAFSGGTATIATNNGLERFFGGAGAYADTTKDSYYHVVVTAVGTSSFAVGDVLRFNTGAGRSITGGSIVPATPHQVTFNVNAAVGFTASIIATVNANAQTEKTKSLQNFGVKVISSPNTTVGGADSIAVSDIYKVAAIYNTGTFNPTGQVTVNATTGAVTSWGTVPSNNRTDVTSRYTIDNGQRDEYYDHGRIVLSGTAPGASDYLVIVYNYFTHSGNGFLGVGSYGIPYQDIPVFQSPTSSVVYNLRDSIDFRPRRADGGTALNNAQLPDPAFTFNNDYQYYVGRVDKIIATSGKSFFVKQGNPSSAPKVPVDEFDGMTLYVLEIPPYTATLNEIAVKYVENKRYTMRDIGKLERRIENIEYYTQLSLLEKQAKDESITDASNLEKFKNGFFVDSFTSNGALFNSFDPTAWNRQIWGWWNFRNSPINTWNKGASRVYSSTVSDSNNVDYHAAIDPFGSELRAEFSVYNLGFSPESYVNTTRTDDIITLDFTESVYINQPSASKSVNVNPYNVIAFAGKIKLNPPNDIWVDTTTLPAVNRVVDVKLADAEPIVQRNVTGFFSRGLLFKEQASSTEIVTNVLGSATSSLGSSVVDLQYAPYIRAKKLYGFATGFKPKARLYPFIEDASLTSVSKPNTLILTNNHAGALFVNTATNTGDAELVSFRTGSIAGPVIATALVGYYSPESTTVSGQRTLQILELLTGNITGATFVTGQNSNSASVTSITSYVAGNALVPDEFGALSFVVDLPGGIYPTGNRTIRLIDNIDNSFSSTSSVGETKYFTQGTLASEQETILTTRTVQNQAITTQTGFYYDPLAETFLVDPRSTPDGLHVSSVDLYFRTKAKSIPVTLEIRKTVNGFPESAITSIPFATVTLTPDKVNISEDGLSATNFKLPAPVHLIPGEYAIVVLANTEEYEVFVAEMGKTDINTNQIISKQPYTGVFFKSQNASTWTPIQEEDIKFRLNSATFESSGTVDFGINDNTSITVSGTTASGSANVTANTTTLRVNDFLYGTGIPSGARILSINSATQFTMTANATASGTITITVIPYIKYQTLHMSSSNVVPTGASLSWSVKLLDAGTEIMDTSFSNIVTDVDFDRVASGAIKPRALNSNTPSIILRATLSTTDSTVSPVIDVSGLSTIFARNIINNTDISVSDAEEVARGGNAAARYISKKVTLADGFDASNLVVTLDAYKPTGTDVRVYYKILPTESSDLFEDKSWVRMKLNGSVANSTAADDFKEHQFYPTNAFSAYGVPVDDPISPRFNVFAIKIVLVSSNEAVTPKVRDLRAVALDS